MRLPVWPRASGGGGVRPGDPDDAGGIRKIPVGETIVSAYRFTFEQIGTIIGLCWAALILMAVLEFLPYAFGNSPMAPGNATAAGRQGLEDLASLLLRLLLFAIVYVPVMRQALGLRHGTALVHFALGPPEFRLFGALILYFLVLIAMAVGIVILGAIFGAITLAAGKNAAVAGALALVLLAVCLGFIYAAIRLGFMIAPVTVAEGQVSLTRGWILTQGNFWRILAIVIAVLLPVYLIQLIGLLAIAGPGLFAPLPSGAAGEQALAARFALVGQHAPQYIGLSLILAPFEIGLGLGAAAAAYRVLVPRNGAVAAAGEAPAS